MNEPIFIPEENLTISKQIPFKAIPAGWYTVAYSDELKPGEIKSLRYFDRDLVLYRTTSGKACLRDAHCPHLGAHLGQGGRVVQETIRCPFHGFCFDTEGQCVSTPYGFKAPPAAKLRTWPLFESHGLLLTYFDPRGELPRWSIQALETKGWSHLERCDWQLRAHPQETSENSVDFGHFTLVHGFVTARVTKEAKTEGPLLTTSYAVERSLDMIGFPRQSIRAEFDVEVHGLGYSLVVGQIPRFGIHFRNFILSTPIDAQHVHLRIATQIPTIPVPGLSKVITRLIFSALRLEVRQDFNIWAHKIFVEQPALARGDGPISLYRRWARQFYPPNSLLAVHGNMVQLRSEI